MPINVTTGSQTGNGCEIAFQAMGGTLFWSFAIGSTLPLTDGQIEGIHDILKAACDDAYGPHEPQDGEVTTVHVKRYAPEDVVF